jgi:hypothetical protein
VLTAQELELIQLNAAASRHSPSQESSSSDAYKQLVRNLHNHPLSTPPMNKPHQQHQHHQQQQQSSAIEQLLLNNSASKLAKEAESAQILKQLLQIEQQKQQQSQQLFQVQQQLQQQQPEQRVNSLYARVQSRKAEEQTHFSSLLTKLIPTQPMPHHLQQQQQPQPQQQQHQNDILRWFPNASSY